MTEKKNVQERKSLNGERVEKTRNKNLRGEIIAFHRESKKRLPMGG